jgi:hypothetical protein
VERRRGDDDVRADAFRDVPASDVEPESVEWLWPGYVPLRAVTLLVGAKGSLKSTFACRLAAQVTTGGFGGEPREVLLLSGEDDLPSFLRPRVEAAGARLDMVRFPEELGERLPRFPDDFERVAEYLEERRPLLAIFDPAEVFIPRFTQPQAARQAMFALHRLAVRFDMSIVLVHHFSKQMRSIDAAIGGAGALSKAARAVHLLGRETRDPLLRLLGRESPDPPLTLGELFGLTQDEDEDLDVVLACHRLNVARKPPSLSFEIDLVGVPGVREPVPRLLLGTEVPIDAEALFRALAVRTRPADTEKVLDQAKHFLLTQLVDGPMKSTDLVDAAKANGISVRSIERARAEIGVLSYREQNAEGRWEWWVRLPPLPDTFRPEDWRADDD